MPFAAVKYVLTFLDNYSEENTILLAGRIPGYKRDDIRLLPSNCSKAVRYHLNMYCKNNIYLHIQKIWEYYIECCKSANIWAAAKTTFLDYWRTLAPQIRVGKPKSDLGWTCQQNNALIMKSVNKPANEKTAVSYNNRWSHWWATVCQMYWFNLWFT